MDGIHKHVLNMKEISDVCLPPLFLENLYGIISSYEGKLTEAMSYFLQGRPIVPTLSRLELKDKSQANIMWQIIRLHTLVEKEQKDLVEHGKEITSQTNMGKAFWNTDIKMSVGIDGSEKSGL
ncbi:hypothetical protein sscle_09g072090 [Sclerotinia sclerotiorum 1980 UF-70]|uniref:Uncharacterized protein n=1 Tax=Sclerotinia sclerotiorum (strain ATCC 18683 / 1980 / Ss-1) TaxID=665079 RepID=A0A1D9QC25_SCLS1|nr:hypothetical protein sscle_09g072090 [Sclerotinia sclerotiorum 1980 UF-70]